MRIPTTVLVTENEAGGFGGGVADCSTGFIFVYNGKESGAAIFGNTAENKLPNLTGDGTEKPEDHIAAQDKIFMENGYNDYYGENFTYIRNWMFNGALEN